MNIPQEGPRIERKLPHHAEAILRGCVAQVGLGPLVMEPSHANFTFAMHHTDTLADGDQGVNGGISPWNFAESIEEIAFTWGSFPWF
jgi:hypothetical protein